MSWAQHIQILPFQWYLTEILHHFVHQFFNSSLVNNIYVLILVFNMINDNISGAEHINILPYQWGLKRFGTICIMILEITGVLLLVNLLTANWWTIYMYWLLVFNMINGNKSWSEHINKLPYQWGLIKIWHHMYYDFIILTNIQKQLGSFCWSI